MLPAAYVQYKPQIQGLLFIGLLCKSALNPFQLAWNVSIYDAPLRGPGLADTGTYADTI